MEIFKLMTKDEKQKAFFEIINVNVNRNLEPEIKFEEAVQEMDDFEFVDYLDITPLIRAASFNKDVMVESLLEKGADPNSGISKHCTPLIAVLENGYMGTKSNDRIIELLLRAGGNPYIKGDYGVNALDVCESYFTKLGIETYYKNFNPCNIKSATNPIR